MPLEILWRFLQEIVIETYTLTFKGLSLKLGMKLVWVFKKKKKAIPRFIKLRRGNRYCSF